MSIKTLDGLANATTQDDVMEIVHASFFTPMGNLMTLGNEEGWGLPMILYGGPGGSKTSRFYQFAKKYRTPFESLKPGSRGEGFFGCTPAVGDNNGKKVLDFPLPRNFVDKFSTGAGLILLDELTTARPAVKPALLGFIQERELGEHKFSPRVRIFGAANPVDEAAAGYDLSLPEANRLGHLVFPDPSIQSFVNYLSTGSDGANNEQLSIDDEEKRVLKAWPLAWAKSVGLIAGFLNRRPDMMRQQPKNGDPAGSGAWPSPRTMEYATRALASAMIHGLSESNTETFMASFVGVACTNEFSTWRRSQDLPDPLDVLDGRVRFEHNRSRIDRTHAVLASCISVVSQKNIERRVERATSMWKFIASLKQDVPDLALSAVKPLKNAGLAEMHIPEAYDVIGSMLPYYERVNGDK